MTERPIYFRQPTADAMVRAVLDGFKTQHREPVQVSLPDTWRPTKLDWLHSNAGPERRSYGFWINDRAAYVSPFGGPGDLLWVREAWAAERCGYCDDGYDDQECTCFASPRYRASWPQSMPPYSGVWRSPIHMLRDACRITRVVNRVWIELLQDISEEDARAEGFHRREHFIRAWDSIYATQGDGFDENPPVIGCEFEK